MKIKTDYDDYVFQMENDLNRLYNMEKAILKRIEIYKEDIEAGNDKIPLSWVIKDLENTLE